MRQPEWAQSHLCICFTLEKPVSQHMGVNTTLIQMLA